MVSVGSNGVSVQLFSEWCDWLFLPLISSRMHYSMAKVQWGVGWGWGAVRVMVVVIMSFMDTELDAST